jgi:hypothetical protein
MIKDVKNQARRLAMGKTKNYPFKILLSSREQTISLFTMKTTFGE